LNLDDNFVPKISDFGVAKLLSTEQTRTCTFIRRTRSYLAPEWFTDTDLFTDAEITAKVDVCSFGIVLLEIICCKRHVEKWASECLSRNSCEQLVEGDQEAMADIERVNRFIQVALSCIQDNPTLRPTMHEVVYTVW
jgi:serine/threonine protein kinase